ncbi:MAG: hypothetical protein MMC23_002828 [Stictis urceolatum]|nr:hypothetical protein [Stictis urceolata]
MYFSSFTALLVCAGAAVGSPVQKREYKYALKEEHFAPHGWTDVGPAPGNHLLNLEIGLKQSQFDELERHLYEGKLYHYPIDLRPATDPAAVSDPDHHRYGQHLGVAEVENLIKPSDEALDLVHEWLADHGISSDRLGYTPAKDWVRLTIPVSEAERLLDTKYSIFLHNDGDYLVRTPKWSLPQHLHSHIDAIQPTNSFFRPMARSKDLKTVKPLADFTPGDFQVPAQNLNTLSNPTVATACNASAVTPLCLRTLYKTLDYKPKAAGKNKVALTNYLSETNNRSDVRIFLERYRPDAVPAASSFKIQVVNGGDNQQTPNTPAQLAAGKDLEGNLDAETILGISYPTPLQAYNTGGMPPFKPDAGNPTDTNEPYLVWQQYILAQKNIPQVVSNSYGDSEQTVPPSYAKRVCEGFAQLGARGVSVFFASGDSGVGEEGFCVTNDGKNSSTFLSEFPTGCPYITSVGATQKFNPEIVALDTRNGFVSGGGFARYFKRPAYQDGVVPAYVKSLKGQFKGLFNANGRAYPDIAAQGEHFVTIWNGTVVLLDGTSASTPTASAVFTLVNDALIAAGKPPLGFLNPWLYKKGFKALNDITSGSAAGCGTKGFPAQKGYDAVTGFGTPDFKKLVASALESYGGYTGYQGGLNGGKE